MLIAGLLFAASCMPAARGMAVSWGSELFGDYRDSYGNLLDETFEIQLGFFQDVLGDPFVPNADNVGEWSQRWKVFDQASLNVGLGYFTSEARVSENGTSTSAFADLGINFVGQQAYVWIRNASEAVPGTEWFLARAPGWELPMGSDECCDPSRPLQWSISELNPKAGDAVTPVWGAQAGQQGAGVFAATSPDFTLQTFTLVPEPSSFFLVLSASLLLLRRKRPGF